MNIVLKMLKARPNQNICDIGSGDGEIGIRLRQTNVTALDISSIRAERVSAKGINGIQGDAQVLPFKDNCFDGIICTEVIEHLPNPLVALSEIKRVLKAGGTGVITVPRDQTPHKTLLDIPDSVIRHSHYFIIKSEHGVKDDHLQFFSEKSLGKLIDQAGLTIKKVEYTLPFKPRFWFTSIFVRGWEIIMYRILSNSSFRPMILLNMLYGLYPKLYSVDKSSLRGHIIMSLNKT